MKFEFVVADEKCPRCGAEGNPKVADENGAWWWKCYTPGCSVGYWLPETGEVEERLSDAERERQDARISAEIAEQMEGMKWIETDESQFGMEYPYGYVSRMIPNDEPVPEGWHLLGERQEEETA